MHPLHDIVEGKPLDYNNDTLSFMVLNDSDLEPYVELLEAKGAKSSNAEEPAIQRDATVRADAADKIP